MKRRRDCLRFYSLAPCSSGGSDRVIGDWRILGAPFSEGLALLFNLGIGSRPHGAGSHCRYCRFMSILDESPRGMDRTVDVLVFGAAVSGGWSSVEHFMLGNGGDALPSANGDEN